MKKAIAILLAIVLCAALVTACGQRPEMPESSIPLADVSDTTTTAEETTTTTEETTTTTTTAETTTTTIRATTTPSKSKTTTICPTTPPVVKTTTTTSITTTTTTQMEPADESPSTDVATCVDNGYFYFVHPYDRCLYRRNLSIVDLNAPGALEKIMSFGGYSNLRVKDNVIYFMSHSPYGKLYCCDADGSNIRVLDDEENIKEFEIAGDWMFVVKYQQRNYRDREILVMMRTDGSQRKELGFENKTNEAGSTVTIHGFNRGKCYYTLLYFGFGEFEYTGSDSIVTTASIGSFYIDYRSENSTAVRWKDGYPVNFYDSLKEDCIYYDIALTGPSADHENNTYLFNVYDIEHPSFPIANIKWPNSYPGARLKDYLADVRTDRYNSMYVAFSDFSGNVKTVGLPLAQGEEYNYTQYPSEQNVHDNIVHLYQSNQKTGRYRGMLVGVDGTIWMLYTGINE